MRLVERMTSGNDSRNLHIMYAVWREILDEVKITHRYTKHLDESKKGRNEVSEKALFKWNDQDNATLLHAVARAWCHVTVHNRELDMQVMQFAAADAASKEGT